MCNSNGLSQHILKVPYRVSNAEFPVLHGWEKRQSFAYVEGRGSFLKRCWATPQSGDSGQTKVYSAWFVAGM